MCIQNLISCSLCLPCYTVSHLKPSLPLISYSSYFLSQVHSFLISKSQCLTSQIHAVSHFKLTLSHISNSCSTFIWCCLWPYPNSSLISPSSLTSSEPVLILYSNCFSSHPFLSPHLTKARKYHIWRTEHMGTNLQQWNNLSQLFMKTNEKKKPHWIIIHTHQHFVKTTKSSSSSTNWCDFHLFFVLFLYITIHVLLHTQPHM